jgi:hypothetical protein
MRVNDYLSVLMCQLNITLDCNHKDEYLIETECTTDQMMKALYVIKKQQPDVTLFPEISYNERLDETYKKFSRNDNIIVAGSYYKNGINYTVVFQNEKKCEIPKGYASGAEPMARRISYINPEKFLETELQKHEFKVKGKKIYIFNCMEYYNLAYYIARNPKYKENLFGIFTICSNSNTHVFEEETTTIHNHNESIYTFMLNCVSTYKGEDYGDGQSYIYGPVSVYEKEWLEKENVNTKKNPTHILSLSKTEAQYVYGEFIDARLLSRFGRSDQYINNPRNIIVDSL